MNSSSRCGKREDQNDEPGSQRDPAETAPQDGGDDQRDSDRDAEGGADDFGAQQRVLEGEQAGAPGEGPDRLFVHAWRERGEEASRDDHGAPEQHLGCNRQAHVALRDAGCVLREMLREDKAIKCGECQEGEEDADFDQRDVAVGGAEQP